MVLAFGVNKLNPGTRISRLERGPSFWTGVALNGRRMVVIS